MYIRIASDLHTCFWNHNKLQRLAQKYLPHDERDKDSVLVVAGDLGIMDKKHVSVLKILAHRFKYVVTVAGNHEFYHNSNFRHVDRWKKENLIPDVFMLENESVMLDGVTFVGATLWTDMNKSNPVDMINAYHKMSDYDYIKKDSASGNPYSKLGTKLVPEDTVIEHAISKQYIFSAAEIYDNVVVVTHHSPTYLTVDEKFKNDKINCAYMSELYYDIEAHPSIKYWICGHQHHTTEVEIGSCKVIQNPLGYHPNQLNKKYVPNYFIEV